MVVSEHAFETQRQEAAVEQEKERQLQRLAELRSVKTQSRGSGVNLTAELWGKTKKAPPPAIIEPPPPPPVETNDQLIKIVPKRNTNIIADEEDQIVLTKVRPSTQDEEDHLAVVRYPEPIGAIPALDPLPNTADLPSIEGQGELIDFKPAALPALDLPTPRALTPQAWEDEVPEKSSGSTYQQPAVSATQRYIVYIFCIFIIGGIAVFMLLNQASIKKATPSELNVLVDYAIVLGAALLVWESVSCQVIECLERKNAAQKFDVRASDDLALSKNNLSRGPMSRSRSISSSFSLNAMHHNTDAEFNAVGITSS